jgi:hypothetical protein
MAPPEATKIFVQLTHCEDLYDGIYHVCIDVFDLQTDTRWSFLHYDYADACQHAERLGFASGRMRNGTLDLMNPYLWFDTLVLRSGETFKEFFQTKMSPFYTLH